MRTRIAQDTDEPSARFVRTSTNHTEQPIRRACRPRLSRLVAPLLAGGSALIVAALVAAASLGPTTAGAEHSALDGRHARVTSVFADEHTLAVHERVLMGMRWLTAWRAAHPVPPLSPPPVPQPAAPASAITDATSTTTPDWACIRQHESGDQFNSPTAPGGAYGFLEMTWLSLGYSGWPYQAPAWVQARAALFLYNELGWQPWSTRFVCGL